VEELMQTADVFVMPSEEEGSPHALIEAMAYGLPLVAFDVGGVRETASPAAGKFIYTYGEVAHMALGITTLLTDDSEYRAQQQAESEWVVRFGKKVIQDSFVELFYGSQK
jgi:glycosyltransferase involved in cell wall biosynthesis